LKRLLLDSVSDGSTLGRTLFNERGDVLLRRGALLNRRYIESLRDRGFRSLYIADGPDDDLAPDEIVSEHVRANATASVHRFLNVVATARLDRRSGASAERTMSEEAARALITRVASLRSVVESVIDEVLQANNLPGLTELKTHDNYTFCHSIEVTITAIMIGRELHFDRAALRELAMGCILHDVGKMFIAPQILNRPGRLTKEEMELVKSHPGAGYRFLRGFQPDAYLINHVAYQHHERQDGTGYPRGLTGQNRIGREGRSGRGEMLLIAEIAAVADVYDALSSDRPHRPGMAPDQVVEMIRSMAGTHLNREVVNGFLSIVPAYPVGSAIHVTEGPFTGFCGVVVNLNTQRLDRPRIRLDRDRSGRRIDPFEIDLVWEPLTQIAIILFDRELRQAG